MPLGLLGSCTDRCGPCEGCFGGLSQDGCKLRWATSGDPYAVEVRLNAVVQSTQASGFLVNPASGVYELWVKCKSGDDWELLDSESWTKKSNTVCRPCCIEAGVYQSGFGGSIYCSVNLGGDPFWSLYNGTYQLTNFLSGQTCACHFRGGYQLTFPGLADPVNSGPGSVNGGTCGTPVLPSLYWFAGQIAYGPCPGSPSDWRHIYDIYYIPNSIQVDVKFGGDSTNSSLCGTANLSGVSVDLQVKHSIWVHRRDTGNPASPGTTAEGCWRSITSLLQANGVPMIGGEFNVSKIFEACGSVSLAATVAIHVEGWGACGPNPAPGPGSFSYAVDVLMP